MVAQQFLDESVLRLKKLKTQADRAIAQVDETQMFARLDTESNSIAIVMKHMAGNMRSRWTDFLTSDGEKASRARDREFEAEGADTPESILLAWEDGWARVFAAIEPLSPADVERVVTIRGERHTVLQAINRQVSHYAEHVGQIVLLAKHYAGPRWQSLSIPRGQSKLFDAAQSGSTDEAARKTSAS